MRIYSLLLLASAALLAGCAAQHLDECDLSDPNGLSRCIKELLDDSRPKIRQEADPFRLPNFKEDDLSGSNVVVTGIAGYSVNQLSVSFPSDQQISVVASITWPRIRVDLDVKLRKCRKILWKWRCLTLRARPDVHVGRTVGTLNTTMNVDVAPDGTVSVTARGTSVSLNLASVRVKANVRGTVGILNRLFGDPASRIATKLTNKWWRNNKEKIETKARNALDKAIREKVSDQLSQLLNI